ncbi:MAG: TIGR03905 family TSCPD domain-containing protein [Clostridia bacterium]|nr:TIGR03905 family TSCPD domain-containing protein [Clostridia bacterium]
MYIYKTFGTCSREIQLDIQNNIIQNVKFIGGCNGNLQGISKLVIGQNIDDVIAKLQGIECRNDTSCPDQLAKALIKYKMEN